MLTRIHRFAGVLALAMIASFWVSTVLSELLLDEAAVTAVKTMIPWGFIALVPALAAVGGSGVRLADGRRAGLIGAKFRRMPVIAGNGLIVLVPSALFLASRAYAGNFDTAFYAVQALELVAGAVNVALLSLNVRDGLRMTRRRGQRNDGLRPA